VKVFFDHCLSFTLAHALAALFRDQHEVVALQDKFRRDIRDIDWIRALSTEGHWVVVSGDQRITRNRAERAAFQNSQLTGFFMALALNKAPVLKQLERLCALWSNMLVLSTAAQPGALYELPIKGNLPRPLRT
jgi:PIN like domain